MDLGLVHVYTGDGKGKTTAATGLALRAASSGLRVLFVQFMKEKSAPSSEIVGLERCGNVSTRRYGGNLLKKPGESEQDAVAQDIKDAIREGLEKVLDDINEHNYDLIVLDEINVALSFGLADLESVRHIINACKGQIELVLTGRDAPEAILQRADYVTELLKIKHPYDQGIGAREGIEF